jgi:NAD-dependent SIR2 family protein deacetylase
LIKNLCDKKYDLLVVVGNSLSTSPVKFIPVLHTGPVLLINKQKVLDSPKTLWMNGDCDEVIQRLCE